MNLISVRKQFFDYCNKFEKDLTLFKNKDKLIKKLQLKDPNNMTEDDIFIINNTNIIEYLLGVYGGADINNFVFPLMKYIKSEKKKNQIMRMCLYSEHEDKVESGNFDKMYVYYKELYKKYESVIDKKHVDEMLKRCKKDKIIREELYKYIWTFDK
jgi:hypothetical protein